MQRFVNFKKSKGDYLCDSDGNRVLDLNASASGQVLGYNHDDLVLARDSELYDRFVTHKVDANTLPSHDLADIIREQVMGSAPKGQVQVHLGAGKTAAEANELAVAVALQHYAEDNNMTVGQLCVLGFDNAHHGSTTATLSFSATDANVAGLPAFPWPKAEYPQLKYPFAQYEQENIEEENRCVGVVQSIIDAKRAEGGAVGAIVVEPISSIGNQFATPNFYRKLRALAKDEGIPFIVDETKTGLGASGKQWAQDYWYLPEDQAPDFTTFGGKAGISGFFSTIDHRLNDEATSYSQNVNMVDLLRYGQI